MGALYDFLDKVNKWIDKHTPIDSETVFWERRAEGILAHAKPQQLIAAGEDYAGPFNITQKDDTTLTIGKDSINPIIYNGVEYDFAETNLTVTQEGYICLKKVKSQSDVLEILDEVPNSCPGYIYWPIGYVWFEDDIITDFEQIQFGEISLKDEYTGDFAVYKTGDMSVLISSGTMVLGTTTYSFPATSQIISTARYIYLKITYASGAYTIAVYVSSSSTMAQTSTEFYVPIANITVDSGITAINQRQRGAIIQSGRVL